MSAYPTKPGDPHYPRGSGRTWKQLEEILELAAFEDRSFIFVTGNRQDALIILRKLLTQGDLLRGSCVNGETYAGKPIQYEPASSRYRIGDAFIEVMQGTHRRDFLRIEERAMGTRATIVYDHAVA